MPAALLICTSHLRHSFCWRRLGKRRPSKTARAVRFNGNIPWLRGTTANELNLWL